MPQAAAAVIADKVVPGEPATSSCAAAASMPGPRPGDTLVAHDGDVRDAGSVLAAYQQDPQAVGGSLAWSALLAVLPLATVFVLLGGVRVRAQWAALAGLAVSLVVAVVGFAMPVGQAVLAATHGAVFGLFPILWIVVNALWVFNMTVATGHFDVLRRSFGALSLGQPHPGDPGRVLLRRRCWRRWPGSAPRWRSPR